MSTSGETADLMVKEGIQITESAVKLAGLGAKNLAALLIALADDNQKLAGKTKLKRLVVVVVGGLCVVVYFFRHVGFFGWIPLLSQRLRRSLLPHREQGGEHRHGGNHGESQRRQADQPHL